MTNDKPTIMPPVPVIASISSLIIDQLEKIREILDNTQDGYIVSEVGGICYNRRKQCEDSI
jgi:hypothetical protein